VAYVYEGHLYKNESGEEVSVWFENTDDLFAKVQEMKPGDSLTIQCEDQSRY
jgi:hypothetical protein